MKRFLFLVAIALSLFCSSARAATFGNDAFTNSNGTALTSHTPTTAGVSWSTAGTAGSSIQIQSNKARASADDQVVELDAAPAGTDYSAQADFTFYANANCGVVVRQQATDSRYAFFRSGGGAFSIYKAGTASPGFQGSSVTVSLSSGVVYRLYLEAVGTSSTALKARVQRQSDGLWLTSSGTWQSGQTECIDTTDSTNPITTAGKAGIYLSTSDGSSTGMVADDFLAADIGGATYDSFATNSSALKWSPYNWKVDGTAAESNTPGAYLKFRFSGTGARLVVDSSGYSGFTTFPVVRWTVDNGSWQSQTFTGATSEVVLASSLANANHDVLFFFEASDYTKDRWSTPTNKLRITSIGVSTGGTLGTVTVWSGRMLVFGDSITEGASTGSGFRQSLNWPWTVSDALQCEVGIVGFGGQGWYRDASGGSNVPKFHDAASPSTAPWKSYWSGSSRLTAGLFSPAPDKLIISLGKNDALNAVSTSSVEASIADALPAIRTAAGASCQIFVVIPTGAANTYRSTITSAVNAYRSGDAKCYLVDLSTDWIPGAAGSADAWTVDGIHHTSDGAARIASQLIGAIKQLTATGGAQRSYAY